MLSVVVMGDRTIQDFHLSMEVRSPLSYCPARVRRCPQTCWPGWLLAWPTWCHPARSARAVPRRWRWRSAWMRSLRCFWTGCHTGVPAGWWGSPRPRWATAWTCCLLPWPRWGIASPTAASSPAWTTCAAGLGRWPQPARRCAWTGWPPGCSAPAGGPTRRCCTTPSGIATPPRAWPYRPSTATCCGWTVAGRAVATSTNSSRWQGG